MIAIVNPQYYGVHGIARYIDSFLANLPQGNYTVYLITSEPVVGLVKSSKRSFYSYSNCLKSLWFINLEHKGI